MSLVTIDLGGTAEAASSLTPTELVRRFNQFYESATKAVIARDGTLDKLLAGEVVAFFGAPYNETAHEERAVDAALDVMRSFGGFWGEDSLIGGAVGTGLAFIGNIGEGETRDYTAIGQLPSLVGALAREAVPGELLMHPETYAAVAARFPDASARSVPLRGAAKPVAVRVLTVARPRESATSGRRRLATILSLDLVGSTDIAARLGDAAWRDLLARHYVEVRRCLLAHGGAEVDTAGDGLLATFDVPLEGIRFAQEVSSIDRELGLTARVGIHTGEVIQDGPAIRGIAVVIAARIAAQAGPNEIFVSRTVRDLVAGSGVTFVDRGTRALKGVPEPHEIYEALT